MLNLLPSRNFLELLFNTDPLISEYADLMLTREGRLLFAWTVWRSQCWELWKKIFEWLITRWRRCRDRRRCSIYGNFPFARNFPKRIVPLWQRWAIRVWRWSSLNFRERIVHSPLWQRRPQKNIKLHHMWKHLYHICMYTRSTSYKSRSLSTTNTNVFFDIKYSRLPNAPAKCFCVCR